MQNDKNKRSGARTRPPCPLFFSLLIFLLLNGCAGVRTYEEGDTQSGLASWYGEPFHGRKTSSGETFDMYEHTAAHRTLPFGTVLRVTNLENGREVTVRVNDRGPFVRGRIVDLSYAAAKELRMMGSGVAKVEIEVVSMEQVAGPFVVQIGSFDSKDNAAYAMKRIWRYDRSVYIERARTGHYRVRLGPFDSRGKAQSAIRRLSEDAEILRDLNPKVMRAD